VGVHLQRNHRVLDLAAATNAMSATNRIAKARAAFTEGQALMNAPQAVERRRSKGVYIDGDRLVNVPLKLVMTIAGGDQLEGVRPVPGSLPLGACNAGLAYHMTTADQDFQYVTI